MQLDRTQPDNLQLNGVQHDAPEPNRRKWRTALLPLAAVLLGWLLWTTWMTSFAAPGQDPRTVTLNAPLAPDSFDLSISKKSNPITFTVAITGNQYIISVVVSGTPPFVTVNDQLPSGMKWTQINAENWNCAPGDITLVNCTYGGIIMGTIATLPLIFVDVEISPDVAYIVTNTAEIIDITDIITANNSATIMTTVDSVDLEIDKTVEPEYADVGETITYTLVVTNYGPAPATGVVVTETLPVSLTFGAPITITTGSYQAITTTGGITVGQWTIGTLLKDLKATLVLTGTPKEFASGYKITNTAIVTSSNKSDWNPANNSDTEEFTVGGLNISKRVNKTNAYVGEPILFTLTVNNEGTVGASSVIATDYFTTALDILSYSTSKGWVSISSSSSYHKLTNSIGSLLPNETVTILVDTRANRTIELTTTLTNTATAESYPQQTRISEQVSVEVIPSADLQVGKTDGKNTVDLGKTITYTVGITNTGSLTATAVRITDTLSSYLNFISIYTGTLEMTQTLDTKFKRAWILAEPLDPGEKISFYLSAHVPLTTPVSTHVANTFEASTESLEGYLGNNSITDIHITTVQPTTAISVAKSVKPSQAKKGDSFTFQIELSNSGQNAATNLKVSDVFPTVLDITSARTSLGTATINASSRKVSVNVGTLNPGQKVGITIVARVNVSATTNANHTNRALATWDTNQSLGSNQITYRVKGQSTLPGTGGILDNKNALTNLSRLALAISIFLGLGGLLSLAYGLWSRAHRPVWASWFTKAGLILLAGGLVFVILSVGLGRATRKTAQLPIVSGEKPPAATDLLPTVTDLPTNTPAQEPVDLWESSFTTPTPDKLPDYPIPTPSVQSDTGTGEALSDTSPIVRIVIPALDLDTVVKYVPFNGQTWLIGGLKHEVAWMGDTSWPGLGSNTSLAGHVTLSDGSYGPFRFLDTLNTGDQVVLYTDQNIYTYQVLEQMVVEDGDLSVIQQTDDPQLTLITCTDWHDEMEIYLKRLIVRSELVNVKPITSE